MQCFSWQHTASLYAIRWRDPETDNNCSWYNERIDDEPEQIPMYIDCEGCDDEATKLDAEARNVLAEVENDAKMTTKKSLTT